MPHHHLPPSHHHGHVPPTPPPGGPPHGPPGGMVILDQQRALEDLEHAFGDDYLRQMLVKSVVAGPYEIHALFQVLCRIIGQQGELLRQLTSTDGGKAAAGPTPPPTNP